MCDFCDRTEHEVKVMAEVVKPKPKRDVHICLDCAKHAVARMEGKA
jgi:protein-arginine kinase activator protein McsA